MDESYAEVGTKVILGRHKRRTRVGIAWCEGEMDAYVGSEATICDVFKATDDCMACYVDIDQGQYYWRAEDMILASDVPLLTPEQKRYLRIQDG